MCHVLLFLPVVALPVFWLLPLSIELPAYALALGIALWIYALAIKTARLPVMTGAGGEPLAKGETVRVVGIEGLRLKARRRER